MRTPQILPCLTILALTALAPAQTPPSAYTITQALPGPDGGTMTIYRSGAQAVIEYRHPAKPDGTPASRSLSFYDLKAGVSHTWDPSITPPSCSVGNFSGDWGDPFEATRRRRNRQWNPHQGLRGRYTGSQPQSLDRSKRQPRHQS